MEGKPRWASEKALLTEGIDYHTIKAKFSIGTPILSCTAETTPFSIETVIDLAFSSHFDEE
jgi:hypothetical protein